MNPFLHELVISLAKQNKINENSLFVLPSKRAGNYLKKSMASVLEAPIFSPQIMSVEEFIQELSGLKPASATELAFTLYDCYKDSKIKDKDDFLSFSSWGMQLLQDFNEIDRYLLNVDSFFPYWAETKKLQEWKLSLTKENLASKHQRFLSELLHIYKDFTKVLLKNGFGYQGLIYRTAERKKDAFLKNTNYNEFYFIGFNALNKAESEIITYFLENSTSEVYWDVDSYFMNDDVHSASHFIREYLKNWPYYRNHPKVDFPSNYLSEKQIEIIGMPKNISQAKYVGDLLNEQYRPNERTALILSDESLLEPILTSITLPSEQINVTMGQVLSQTKLNGFFESLFELHIKTSDQGFYYQDLFAFLDNPYCAMVMTENGLNYAQKIKSHIEKHNLVFVKFAHLSHDTDLPKTIAIDLLFEASVSTLEFIENCLRIIDSMTTRFLEEHNTFEVSLLYQFKEIFVTLRTYVQAYSFLDDKKTVKQVYLDIVSNSKLDYKGDPDKGLQIMGMLESRNLDYDTVIITSVNEGILPSGKTNTSFIPYDVKREFSMPTYREKDAVYAYHFYRLLQRAKRVYLLYNTEPDVLEGGERSRFLTQLLTDENINGNIEHTLAFAASALTKEKSQTIGKTQTLIQEIRDLTQRGLSPTSLSDYIKNPMVFYKRHILGIDDRESIEESMAPSTFGTLVHDTLEEIFTPFIGEILTSDKVLTAEKSLPAILSTYFSKLLPNTDIKSGKSLIIYHVILRYLENFLKKEAAQSKKHTVRILALEEKLSCHINIPNHAETIVLKGKLDRIDEIDGQLRIIDYKTGKVASSEIELMDWDALITESKYAKAFQLLCYAKMYTAQNPIKNLEAGIIPIKKTDPSLLRFATKDSVRGPKNHQITEDTLQHFDKHLEKLILEILNPEIPFIEKEE